jgi:serine/threonine protein kinase
VLLEESDVGTLVPVLADFGVSRMLANRTKSVKYLKPFNYIGASMPYASPELLLAFADKHAADNLLSNSDVAPKVDIYAFGMTLYEMLTGLVPWSSVDNYRIKVAKGERPELSDAIAERCPDLIVTMKRLWSQNPADRPAAAELLLLLNC